MASPSLQGTIGATQVGSIFSGFLFGIETLQTHIYFQTFKDDRWELKSLVLGLWTFPFPYIGASSLLGGVIAFLVHNLIEAACFVAAFARFFASLVLGVQAAQARDLVVYRRDWGWLITSLLVVGAFIDICITVAMIYYLTCRRKQVFTFMGAITMIIVVDFFPPVLLPTAYSGMAGYLNLHGETLLATLNSRSGIRTGLSQGSSSIDPSQFRVGGRSRNPVSMVTTVEMKTTVHTVRDEPENLDKSYGLGPDQRKDDNGIAYHAAL
ncbi:hypothetical protein BKA70DRAFT_1231133 [Coprinopsis sp. MPI-PUGE-AT-0042]|nr:hypothetical protein BKA70DRAFT_1231133 [Coprinopsis sp. MPI-PUGE-AT-0042]